MIEDYKKWTPEKIRALLAIKDTFNNIKSLDAPIGDGSTDYAYWIPDDGPGPVELDYIAEGNEILRNCLIKYLTPREADIIRLRYGLDTNIPLTLEQIGKIYKITRERIRQIEQIAMNKLKRGFHRDKISREYFVEEF